VNKNNISIEQCNSKHEMLENLIKVSNDNQKVFLEQMKQSFNSVRDEVREMKQDFNHNLSTNVNDIKESFMILEKKFTVVEEDYNIAKGFFVVVGRILKYAFAVSLVAGSVAGITSWIIRLFT